MKKFFLAAVLFTAAMVCAREIRAQNRSQTPVSAVKKKGKPANYQVMDDKEAMTQVNNHARAAGNEFGNALKKANAEAAKKHERAKLEEAKKKAGK